MTSLLNIFYQNKVIFMNNKYRFLNVLLYSNTYLLPYTTTKSHLAFNII